MFSTRNLNQYECITYESLMKGDLNRLSILKKLLNCYHKPSLNNNFFNKEIFQKLTKHHIDLSKDVNNAIADINRLEKNIAKEEKRVQPNLSTIFDLLNNYKSKRNINSQGDFVLLLNAYFDLFQEDFKHLNDDCIFKKYILFNGNWIEIWLDNWIEKQVLKGRIFTDNKTYHVNKLEYNEISAFLTPTQRGILSTVIFLETIRLNTKIEIIQVRHLFEYLSPVYIEPNSKKQLREIILEEMNNILFSDNNREEKNEILLTSYKIQTQDLFSLIFEFLPLVLNDEDFHDKDANAFFHQILKTVEKLDKEYGINGVLSILKSLPLQLNDINKIISPFEIKSADSIEINEIVLNILNTQSKTRNEKFIRFAVLIPYVTDTAVFEAILNSNLTLPWSLRNQLLDKSSLEYKIKYYTDKLLNDLDDLKIVEPGIFREIITTQLDNLFSNPSQDFINYFIHEGYREDLHEVIKKATDSYKINWINAFKTKISEALVNEDYKLLKFYFHLILFALDNQTQTVNDYFFQNLDNLIRPFLDEKDVFIFLTEVGALTKDDRVVHVLYSLLDSDSFTIKVNACHTLLKLSSLLTHQAVRELIQFLILNDDPQHLDVFESKNNDEKKGSDATSLESPQESKRSFDLDLLKLIREEINFQDVSWSDESKQEELPASFTYKNLSLLIDRIAQFPEYKIFILAALKELVPDADCTRLIKTAFDNSFNPTSAYLDNLKHAFSLLRDIKTANDPNTALLLSYLSGPWARVASDLLMAVSKNFSHEEKILLSKNLLLIHKNWIKKLDNADQSNLVEVYDRSEDNFFLEKCISKILISLASVFSDPERIALIRNVIGNFVTPVVFSTVSDLHQQGLELSYLKTLEEFKEFPPGILNIISSYNSQRPK